MISNSLLEFEIFVTAYIIEGSLVAYQIGYVVNSCHRRQFQTLMLQKRFSNSSIIIKGCFLEML